MPEMTWAMTVQEDGAKVFSTTTDSETAEAVDTVEVTLAAGDTDKKVDIQPGEASQIQLLVIKSSLYDDVSYKASTGAADSAAVTLDAPHVFTGGSVVLFGLDPKQLKFTNASTTKSATVRIFVARDATP